MERASRIAIGASLLALGALWFPVSYLAVTALFSSGWNGGAFLALVLLATAFVTVGVGFLFYGAFSPAQSSKN